MYQDIELKWAATYEYPLPWHLLPHMHNFYQLFYVLEGTAMFMIGEKKIEVSAGHSILAQANIMHEAKSVSSKKLVISEVMFRLKDESFEKRMNKQTGILKNNDMTNKLMNYVVTYGNSREAEIRESAEMYLSTLLWELSISQQGLDKIACNAYEIDVSGFSDVSCEVVRFISENYSKQITLDTLSKAIGYHKSYICTLFKKDTEITVNEYLNFIRIKLAAEYLTYSDCDIASVCAAVGFLNISHFNRTFKKFLNVPPGHYHRVAKTRVNSALLENNSLYHLENEPLLTITQQLGALVDIFR